MVTEAGLELKEEQSSQNERKNQETQKKICQGADNLLSHVSSASAAHMATNTLIMTPDTGRDPDTRWIERKRRTRYRALLAKH